MKAILVREFGGPEVLRLEELPDPSPGPGQVLVRVKAAGVNPVETYRRAGSNGYRPPLPFTPGSDAAGLVQSVGEGVRGLQQGARVWVSGAGGGTYAELVLCDRAGVHPLPEALSFAQGAAVGVPYGTAYRALFQRGRAALGETLLIHGASGGVGIAAVQLARAAGLRALGTAGTERGLRLVTEQGAHQVFDHRAEGYADAVLAATGGRGVDLILEMLANVNLGKDLTLLAPRGRVVVIGSRGQATIDPRETMIRDAEILGLSLRNAPPHEREALERALGAGLADGSLRPVINRELPLKDAPEAHRLVLEPGAYGKIVLTP